MFSTRLRIALECKGMKPAILAYRLGVDRSTISNYLNGKYKAKIEMVRKIAKILGVSADWLSGLDVPMTEDESLPPTEELIILSDGEKALLDLFRLAAPYQQEVILRMIEAAVTPKG